jgi:hypothetical protein
MLLIMSILFLMVTADVNTSSIPADCSTMSTTTRCLASPVTERESTVTTSTDNIIIIVSLAGVIALILLLLVIVGIVLAIAKVLRKRYNIKEVTQVKYISGEGGYVETEDGSGVDGGFDNQVVSFILVCH